MARNVLEHRPALRGWRRIFISLVSLVLVGLGTLVAVPGARASAVPANRAAEGPAEHSGLGLDNDAPNAFRA